MERYSIITEKRPREIVLLRGFGCAYRQCTFCDYHLDCSADGLQNFAVNRAALDRVTGEFGELEVINSGSVFELDDQTLLYIKRVCEQKSIRALHVESHYMYRDRLSEIKAQFPGVDVKFKLGLETFDLDLRERVLKKGIPDKDPAVIAQAFSEANFLFGIKGQTVGSMRRDVRLGKQYFERICVNIMCKNSTDVLPDAGVITAFKRELLPELMGDERVDVLIKNTDFGVGA